MMKQIQIFKTNIRTRSHMQSVTRLFASVGHVQHWTVDLEDCDRVLRVVTLNFSTHAITKLLRTQHIHCEPMACFPYEEA